MYGLPDSSGILTRMRGHFVLSSRRFEARLLRQPMRVAARCELGELKGTLATCTLVDFSALVKCRLALLGDVFRADKCDLAVVGYP